MKAHAILVSYWALFIVTPTAVASIILGFSMKAFIVDFFVFLALVVIGERGIRHWGRFWMGR